MKIYYFHDGLHCILLLGFGSAVKAAKEDHYFLSNPTFLLEILNLLACEDSITDTINKIFFLNYLVLVCNWFLILPTSFLLPNTLVWLREVA